MERIRAVSRVMSIACLALAGVLVVIVALQWFAPWSRPYLIDRSEVSSLTVALTPLKRALGLGLTLVPVAFAALAFVRLSRVFAKFERGAFFKQETVDGLRATAWAGVWATITKLFVTPLLYVAMTFDNPPGERMLAVSVSSNDLIFLMFAVTFLVLAWVMSEGRRIADDLDQII